MGVIHRLDKPVSGVMVYASVSYTHLYYTMAPRSGLDKTAFTAVLHGSMFSSPVSYTHLFRRSQIRSCALPLDGLHLHLVGFGAFGWKNILALEVAVHHDDGGSVPVDVADNDCLLYTSVSAHLRP